jgi:protein MpaA
MPAIGLACLIALCVAASSPSEPVARSSERTAAKLETIGDSAQDRPIRARRTGGAQRRAILLVGSIHGDETQGHRILREALERRRALAGVELWTIETLNPDGVAAGTRGNAHGVDLNRNFREDWRAIPASSGYYSGPRPLSEPEARTARRFIRRIRPQLTVWYHQPWGRTLIPCDRQARRIALRYARLSGLPPRDCYPSPPGSATGWQNEALGTPAFVVELPAGRLQPRTVRRHARAVIAIASR